MHEISSSALKQKHIWRPATTRSMEQSHIRHINTILGIWYYNSDKS